MIFVSAFILWPPGSPAVHLHFFFYYPAGEIQWWEGGAEGQEGETKGSAADAL